MKLSFSDALILFIFSAYVITEDLWEQLPTLYDVNWEEKCHKKIKKHNTNDYTHKRLMKKS
jgi:hypothetical protein